MRTAFKEWVVICRALGTGRQVLILRKGGIGEEAGTFRPEHCEFLFLPTGFHQSPEKVLAEARCYSPLHSGLFVRTFVTASSQVSH